MNIIEAVSNTTTGTVSIPPGMHTITETINLPPGVSLVGAGKSATTILVRGPINGIVAASPSGFVHTGGIRGLTLHGDNEGLCGISFKNRQQGIIEEVCVRSFTQQGVSLDYTLMMAMRDCLIMGCGGPVWPSVEIDNSTTFLWDHSRISGSQPTAKIGMSIDRTTSFSLMGGCIESCGLPLDLGGKTTTIRSVPTGAGVVSNLVIENPNRGADCFVRCGYGWPEVSDGAVRNVVFQNCAMWPSGARNVAFGMKFRSTRNIRVEGCVCALSNATATVAYLLFEGAANRFWSTGVNDMMGTGPVYVKTLGLGTGARANVPYVNPT